MVQSAIGEYGATEEVRASAPTSVVAGWMAQHNLGVVGHDMRAPLSTLTTSGTQQQVCAAYMVKLRGTSTALSAHAPMPTLTAGGNHIAAVAVFMSRNIPGFRGDVADEAAPVLIKVGGEDYMIVDIGMRMLDPREAARAHELTLPGQIELGGVRRPLTKTEAMRLIGNSVPKRMARLLAEANKAHTLYLPQQNRLAAD
jgi:DNA (cytosine-5)-methyltransferase 1